MVYLENKKNEDISGGTKAWREYVVSIKELETYLSSRQLVQVGPSPWFNAEYQNKQANTYFMWVVC